MADVVNCDTVQRTQPREGEYEVAGPERPQAESSASSNYTCKRQLDAGPTTMVSLSDLFSAPLGRLSIIDVGPFKRVYNRRGCHGLQFSRLLQISSFLQERLLPSVRL
jgi:hypothetical protein